MPTEPVTIDYVSFADAPGKATTPEARKAAERMVALEIDRMLYRAHQADTEET